MKLTSHKSVPSKVIAVPPTISPELAEVVAQSLPSIDIPQTEENWRAIQTQLDNAKSDRTRWTAKALGAKITEPVIAGVKSELHVYEAQSHADYLRSYPSPESQDALREIALFFDQAML
jgi:hypothetical protein